MSLEHGLLTSHIRKGSGVVYRVRGEEKQRGMGMSHEVGSSSIEV